MAISKPHDRDEQAADRVGERVLQTPESRLQRACACGGVCPECQPEKRPQGHERLQTQSSGSGDLEHTAAPPIVAKVLSAPGQPLDTAVRAFMESRFGYDFSDVRVHTDQLAARSAEVVAAQAYTVGSHMVFGVGRYAPASRDGQRLLAHELAHVVQQSARDLSHALPADGRTDVLRHTLHDETHRGTAGNVAGVLRVARQPKTPPTKTPPKTVFHPGVMHNHKPSGRWAEVQAAPNSDRVESFVCQNGDPAAVMTAGVLWKLRDKWIASDHIRWFFKDGGGADYVEDSNLESMLRSDAKIQAVLRALIPKDRSSGTFVSRVEIRQDDYDDEDFRFAFGAIDRLDFEANFDAGTLHVWFQDRYEWHPVYPKLYAQLPGDKVRSDNCVHAAAVELKSGKARDYWMKGEATIPLTALQSAAYRWTPPEAIL